MAPVIIAIVVLLLIILILVIPTSAARQEAVRHQRMLTAMEEVSDDAKERITQVHQAYRAELTRAARAHVTRRGDR